MLKLLFDKTQIKIKPHHVLMLLVLFNILIATWIGNDFGEGWDENTYYRYGERSLEAYTRGINGLELIPKRHIFFFNLRYYGPFYAVVGKITTDILSFVAKKWSYQDIWHFVNFIFSQGAAISLYIVAKRFMRPWIAISIVLMFATQPLLFGHSFINPKDIPFTTFFLASIASGLIMVEAQENNSSKTNASTNGQISTAHSYNLIVAVFFSLFVFSIVGKDIIESVISAMISFVYYSPFDSFWGRLFSILANRASLLPVENYIQKAVNTKLDKILLVIVFTIICAKKFTSDYKQSSGKLFSSLINQIDLQLIFKILIAGIVLGLATSTRLLAPFAGFLIIGYSLFTLGKKSITNLIYYFSIAALTTYLTWPFLWDKPVHNFLESFQVMKNFPFTGAVQFMGSSFSPSNLPWTYIPILILLQLTEPAIILGVTGFFISVWKFIKNPSSNKNLPIILFWFMVPIGLFIALDSTGYDNFRQFLFVLPPIFILLGIALDEIFKFINHKLASFILTVAILLPGIIGISSLHPYEYIYYNSFVGGISGADKNFETDYWLTSYRQTTSYINLNAPINAQVLVWGGRYNVEHNVREDIKVYGFSSEDQIEDIYNYDYVVVTTRYDKYLTIFPDAETVFEVRKNGVLLSVVKKLKK